MMLSKADSGKKTDGNLGSAKLLRELEAINRAFKADKTVSRLASSTASSRSKSIEKAQVHRSLNQEDAKHSSRGSIEKDKRSSIWSWRGLKALTHIRNLRFNCCFSLLVHSIDGLPSFFNGESIFVHWKRRDGDRMTCSVRVSGGVAKFEEHLTFSCSVYGSRSGPHHSAKYEAKHFLLYASVVDAPELDLGKHRIDLTRLLPLTLEDLEEKGSGKWTTSFKLSGKAKGAVLSVSFGYMVTDSQNNNDTNEPGCKNIVPEVQKSVDNRARTAKLETLEQKNEMSCHQGGLLKSKPEFCDSINLLHQKLEKNSISGVENKLKTDSVSLPMALQEINLSGKPDGDEEYCASVREKAEFSTALGTEEFTEGHVKLSFDSPVFSQVSDSPEIGSLSDVKIEEDAAKSSLIEVVDQTTEQSLIDSVGKVKELDMTSKELIMKDLEAALRLNSKLIEEGLDSLDESDISYGEKYWELESNFENCSEGKLSLDDFTDSVANDFLEILGMEHSGYGDSESEPVSPRERLLREFEKDALASGSLFDFDTDDNPSEFPCEIPFGSYWGTISEDLDNSSTFEDLNERSYMQACSYDMNMRASKMADIETDALMREWGIDEEFFQNLPSSSSSGFGYSTESPFEDPLHLPSLGDGLGSFIQTNKGGFLRSMSPSIFKDSKSGGSLIMQASNPVVVPAEMGSDITNILQGLASVGLEKLSMQAKKLMPLEEITGKTVQQLAWEGTQNLNSPEGEELFAPGVKGKSFFPLSRDCDLKSLKKDAEYVSLEELAPMAMEKIEALSIEGLRIQSGMSDEDAPSNITPQSVGEISALKGQNVDACGSLGLDGTCGLQLMDVQDTGEDVVDGLMALSLTLDEWVKLDSGEIDDDDLVDDHTTKILAAHHATSLDQFRGTSKGGKRHGKSRKCGLLGNNFTIALMVQLRDPLRDYETVGSPMLALIQVEREFVPPKPKIYCTVFVVGDDNETETDVVAEKKEMTGAPKQDEVPQFKITEVHVAGLKVDDGKKLWGGSKNEQQSSCRWLLANGMGKKTNKHLLMKPKVAAKSDSLWSISHHVHAGAKQKQPAASSPHVRNPNVIVPRNETIRLR